MAKVANTWKNVAGLASQGIVDAAVLFELGGLIQHLAQPSGPVAQCSPMSSIHCHWEKHKKMMSQMAHGMLGGYSATLSTSWIQMIQPLSQRMPNLINLVIQ
jgi:hypothetical protein